MAEVSQCLIPPPRGGGMMEPIWVSFDSNGSPLMVPFEGGFGPTSINSPQQTQPGNETLVNPNSSHTPNTLDCYLSSSASYEPLTSARNLNPDLILDIHGERLASPTTHDQPLYNSFSTVPLPDSETNHSFGKDFFLPVERGMDDPGDLLTTSSSSRGTDASSPADLSVIHEEKFGDLAQIPTMSQHDHFDEPLNSQHTWVYWLETRNTYDPSIHNDCFLPHGAASTTSPLSEYLYASSYCSRASSQSLSRPPVFLNGPGPPPRIKSGLIGKVPKPFGEKAHKCTVCGEQFTRLSSLQAHSFSHTGQKPFRCETEGCGKQFSVSSNLRRHRKVHRSEYQGGYESGQQSASSIATSSASSSVNSFQSNHGRNSLRSFFMRRSNTSSGNGAGKKDFCAGLYTSGVSRSLGRRGPLSEPGRAALRAVKAVGACWRCKILRKKCDPKHPCEGCPKKRGSFWHDIGCRRGAISSETEHIRLCPQPAPSCSLATPDLSNLTSLDIGYTFHFSEAANDILRKGTRKREEEIDMLERLLEIQETVDSSCLHERFDIENRLGDILEPMNLALLPILETISPSLPFEKPLRACILAIIWELVQRSSQTPFSVSRKVLCLLSSAAGYQATSPGDCLIAQSLVCLRKCLETIRTQHSGYLTKFHHQACSPLLCMIECSSNLTLHLELYLDEFSRVIFRKKNLQSDRAWWLSAFYSLCIQDLVRDLLISIVRGLFHDCGEADILASKRYCHLVVKLFIASSGGYDPVMSNYNSAESVLATETNHFKLAQEAVDQSSWAGKNIHSSRDYLCRLFEIDGTFNDEEPE